MYQFYIKRTIPQLEEQIARDCHQRRRAPGYFRKDYRAISLVKNPVNYDPVLFAFKPVFSFGMYRFFCYELLACGEATTVSGHFVWPILRRFYPLLLFTFFFSFLFVTSRASLASPAFLLCVLALWGLGCIVNQLLCRCGKKWRQQLEKQILDYFAQLEREYPV